MAVNTANLEGVALIPCALEVELMNVKVIASGSKVTVFQKPASDSCNMKVMRPCCQQSCHNIQDDPSIDLDPNATPVHWSNHEQ